MIKNTPVKKEKIKSKILTLLTIITCLICAYFYFKENKTDGYIVSKKPWGKFPKIFVEASFSKIRTLSDGLEVVAMLGKPKEMIQKKHPVIIFNRGGNREFGKIEKPTFLIYELIKAGFIRRAKSSLEVMMCTMCSTSSKQRSIYLRQTLKIFL